MANNNPKQFMSANDERSQTAAREHAQRAREALTVLKGHTPRFPSGRYTHQLHIEALTARVKHPDASLAEVAALKGQTKNAYWSSLRRAFIYADRLKNS